ncbi:unnamed protein product [Leuciscus chuanchicus]
MLYSRGTLRRLVQCLMFLWTLRSSQALESKHTQDHPGSFSQYRPTPPPDVHHRLVFISAQTRLHLSTDSSSSQHRLVFTSEVRHDQGKALSDVSLLSRSKRD